MDCEWMDGRIDGWWYWVDVWMDRWMDGQIHEWGVVGRWVDT